MLCLSILCFMSSLVLLRIIPFQEVGCDHLLYSEKEKDRCGICDGNGDSCTLVQSNYSENYMRGKIHNYVIGLVVVNNEIIIIIIINNNNYLLT